MTTETTRRVASPGASTGKTFKDAITGSRKLPSRLVLYARGGVGKTSLAAHASTPFFVLSSGETGLHTLMDAGLVPEEIPNIEVAQWQDVLGVVDSLTREEHNFKTLVFDVMDGINQLANEHVCNTQFAGDWSKRGFLEYYTGYKTVASGLWRSFLASLDVLRAAKSMGIILLAHAAAVNSPNPAGGDFLRYAPDMYKDSWGLTEGWADIVLYADREVLVSKEDGRKKSKATGIMPRTLHTEGQQHFDAKNRHNLPPEISMGDSGQEAWTNFTTAVKNARKEKKHA